MSPEGGGWTHNPDRVCKTLSIFPLRTRVYPCARTRVHTDTLRHTSTGPGTMPYNCSLSAGSYTNNDNIRDSLASALALCVMMFIIVVTIMRILTNPRRSPSYSVKCYNVRIHTTFYVMIFIRACAFHVSSFFTFTVSISCSSFAFRKCFIVPFRHHCILASQHQHSKACKSNGGIGGGEGRGDRG